MANEEPQETTDAAAAKMPHIPYVDWAAQLASATLFVMTRRFGAGFAEEVRGELVAKAARWRASDDKGTKLDVPLLDELIEHSIWADLGAAPVQPQG